MNIDKVQQLYARYKATPYTESEQLMALEILKSMRKYDPKLILAVGFAIVDGMSRGLTDGDEQET